ncbi:MAG: Crp/Fnr family transcriptional regulator [Pseudomonadota bacterium]
MSLESDIRILKSVPFFASFGDEHLRLLAFGGENRRYAPGQPLFRLGDNADGGIVVLSGEVTLITRAETQGGETVVAGTLLGQRALLARTKRSHSAVAAKPVETILIRRTLFLRMLSEFPELANRLYQEMSSELRELTLRASSIIGPVEEG